MLNADECSTYLEPGNPSAMQTGDDEAVQPSKVETRLAPSPNVPRVHDVPPTLANLEYNRYISLSEALGH